MEYLHTLDNKRISDSVVVRLEQELITVRDALIHAYPDILISRVGLSESDLHHLVRISESTFADQNVEGSSAIDVVLHDGTPASTELVKTVITKGYPDAFQLFALGCANEILKLGVEVDVIEKLIEAKFVSVENSKIFGGFRYGFGRDVTRFFLLPGVQIVTSHDVWPHGVDHLKRAFTSKYSFATATYISQWPVVQASLGEFIEQMSDRDYAIEVQNNTTSLEHIPDLIEILNLLENPETHELALAMNYDDLSVYVSLTVNLSSENRVKCAKVMIERAKAIDAQVFFSSEQSLSLFDIIAKYSSEDEYAKVVEDADGVNSKPSKILDEWELKAYLGDYRISTVEALGAVLTHIAITEGSRRAIEIYDLTHRIDLRGPEKVNNMIDALMLSIEPDSKATPFGWIMELHLTELMDRL